MANRDEPAIIKEYRDKTLSRLLSEHAKTELGKLQEAARQWAINKATTAQLDGVANWTPSLKSANDLQDVNKHLARLGIDWRETRLPSLNGLTSASQQALEVFVDCVRSIYELVEADLYKLGVTVPQEPVRVART